VHGPGLITSLATGDVDGDGRADVVISARPPQGRDWRGIGVLRPGGTGGGFSAIDWMYLRDLNAPSPSGISGVPLVSTGSGFTPDIRYNLVTVADMNGDGANDVVVFAQSRALDTGGHGLLDERITGQLSWMFILRSGGAAGGGIPTFDGAAHSYYVGDESQGTTLAIATGRIDAGAATDVLIIDQDALNLARNNRRFKAPNNGALRTSKFRAAVGTQVTLTLANTFAADWMDGGTIVVVEFWVDLNDDRRLDAGDIEVPRDFDANIAELKALVQPSWAGSHRILGVPTDSQGHRARHNLASAFLAIVADPGMSTIHIPGGRHVIFPTEVEVGALNVTLSRFASILFYIDTDGSGEWSRDDAMLGRATRRTNWRLATFVTDAWCVMHPIRLFAVVDMGDGLSDPFEAAFITVNATPFLGFTC
jgi:hypothetical protein